MTVRMYEKRVLVTAGSTWSKIDDVRVIANIFTGATGISIARHFAEMDVETTLMYNPKVATVRGAPRLTPVPYVTFEDLEEAMAEEVASGRYNIVIHSAAVSDYGTQVKQLVEIESPEDTEKGIRMFRELEEIPGKIKSDLPTFTITMGRNRKLVDSVKDWDPTVFLVKFKLEVGRTYEELLGIAEASRVTSRANLIVANDLRGARNGLPSAVILGGESKIEVEKRKMLPGKLYNTIQWELERRK